MNQPIYAIGYTRVSTPKQAAEGNGLEDQESAIRHYAESKGWSLYPDNIIFQEPHTATTSNRPVYNNILNIIRSNPGKVKYFVVKAIDRLSREGAVKFQEMVDVLEKLGVTVQDTANVMQPGTNSLEHLGFSYKWSRRRGNEMGTIVQAEAAKEEIGKILSRMIGAEIQLTTEGYKVRAPNDGYRLAKITLDSGKKRHIQEIDPERGHFFIQMFKLRAEGIYSDAEIVKKINALGYKTKIRNRWNLKRDSIVGKRTGKSLTIKNLQNIIKRPIYCGIICEKWTHNKPIKAAYPGLISIDLFNRANRGKVFIQEEGDQYTILYNYNPDKLTSKRHNYRSEYMFKNIVMCPICNKSLHASASKGKSGKYFSFYHCERGHKRFSVSKDELETKFKEYLSSIQFSDNFLKVFEKVLLLKYKKEEGDSSNQSAIANRNVAELKEKKANMVNSFMVAKSAIVQQEIERQLEALEIEITEAQSHRDKIEINENDIHDFIAHTKKIVEHPVNILANISNKQEQVALFSLFFEKFPTYSEILNGTPKLTLVFKLSSEFKKSESSLVTLQRIEL